MAEGEQARVAEDDVEAHGEEPQDQDVDGQGLVGHEPREDEEEDDHDRHAVAPADLGEARERRPERAHAMSPARPKRPLGRRRGTSAATTNMEMLAMGG